MILVTNKKVIPIVNRKSSNRKSKRYCLIVNQNAIFNRKS